MYNEERTKICPYCKRKFTAKPYDLPATCGRPECEAKNKQEMFDNSLWPNGKRPPDMTREELLDTLKWSLEDFQSFRNKLRVLIRE